MYRYFMFLFWSPLLLAIIINSQNAFSKTCILSLFEKSSKEAKIIDSVFAFYSEADFFRQAQLKDIEKCFLSGEYDEVVWLSHGSSIKTGISSYSTPVLVKDDGSKIVLPLRFFEKLIQQTDYRSLKKVRVNLCGLDFSKEDSRLHSSIDPFIKRLGAENVEVDISERFAFGSFVLKEDVTRINSNWLSKSISLDNSLNFKKWKTNSNTYCMSDEWPGCDRESAKTIIPLSRERVN